MADIELTYGPGAPMAVLKQGLKVLALKTKLKIETKAEETTLADAFHLHFTPQASVVASERMPKALLTCFAVFRKRDAKLTAALDDERTITMRLARVESRDAYKTATREFYEMVARYMAAKDDEARGAVLKGAYWKAGVATLIADDVDGKLRWQGERA